MKIVLCKHSIILRREAMMVAMATMAGESELSDVSDVSDVSDKRQPRPKDASHSVHVGCSEAAPTRSIVRRFFVFHRLA